MGIGDWGLGIGDWGLGQSPIPNPPIPNPQSPFISYNYCIKYIYLNYLKKFTDFFSYIYKKAYLYLI